MEIDGNSWKMKGKMQRKMRIDQVCLLENIPFVKIGKNGKSTKETIQAVY